MSHYEARMSSNGQLTIPEAVRKHFDLKEGDVVDFYIDADTKLVRILARSKRISDYATGVDLPSGVPPDSLTEMDEATAEYLAEKDERISREWRERLTVGSLGRGSFFDGLEELKLPSIGRPVTRADIDKAIDEEIDARHGRTKDSDDDDRL